MKQRRRTGTRLFVNIETTFVRIVEFLCFKQRSLQKDKELEKERAKRKDLEQRLKKLQSKEKELNSIREETEQKLREANNESQQVSENLKQAHKWFKTKFEDLQAELARSKKIQSALERENREQQKKLRLEKKQAVNETEKAKEILRTSRLTLNKLTGDVAENLWETKGMKHALQAEKDINAMTTHKLQRLQHSTARHMEGLVQELDTLRRSVK
ncbi:predicted protein [Nematostella vectensis]|uniref:Uncharacterized protein n=1 Tax=Nematostella vectensis TaxID=45351 RepID=A7SMA1_NEMVE|nr:predicted protein [Nematostella vectensis]|eukprot:XP_001627232.1 predicted protein [Nematostella vectensis]